MAVGRELEPAGWDRLGMVEWFRPGEEERVEFALERLGRIGVRRLRTGVSWALWHTPQGPAWYDWLLPRLASELEILPCFVYTPPSLGVEPKTSAPPRDPKAYADFLDVMLDRHGERFEWVELWNEPNNLLDWDGRLDPDWMIFCRMIGGAAYWAKRRGKKTVLAGTSPTDLGWLRLMHERGVLAHIDAVGVHGFPDTWDCHWPGWPEIVTGVRRVLAECGLSPQVWITEAGHSAWRRDEMRQLRRFLECLEAPADRVYWYAVQDLDPELESQEGFHLDERHYHMGGLRPDGSPRLYWRLLEKGGVRLLRELASQAETPAACPAFRSRRAAPPSAVLVTGGAGFIGANLADRLAETGRQVIVYDNLSRPGAEENLAWLKKRRGDRVRAVIGDVRDARALRQVVAQASHVVHLAAQTAVTTSLTDPEEDFAVNAQGTVNLLTAARAASRPPRLVLASTNKVYGALPDVPLIERDTRWEPADPALARRGAGEERPLDFHSPYGCSKGTADAYVLDHARSYGLPTTVFRMSCVYGPLQHGVEDQGWVAHFLIRGMGGQEVTIFGDGKQVRDVLYVDDLVEAFRLVLAGGEAVTGRAFNIGGGPNNCLSLLELLDLMDRAGCPPVRVRRQGWRTGDQRWYVSDPSAFGRATGWAPRTGVAAGVARLMAWLAETRFLRRAAPRLEVPRPDAARSPALAKPGVRTPSERRAVP